MGALVKAPLLASVSPAGLEAGIAQALGPPEPGVPTRHQRACLKRIGYLMFPHPALGDGPYERAVAAIAGSVAGRADLAKLVDEGVAGLDAGEARPWIEREPAEQIARLQAIEAQPFFRWLYQATLELLYNDDSVWSHIGYEGSSFERGGYLERGFDDIDWL
jgi:hypothetical protein